MPFEIVRNDITKMQVDIIVNAGVDGAIHKKAGPSLLEARKKIGYIQPGTAAIFLGANIDAAREAARFGITEDCAANYHADQLGTAVIYEAMSEAVCHVRANRAMSRDWKRKVEEDYRKRGK